jgi:hypothetical protein
MAAQLHPFEQDGIILLRFPKLSTLPFLVHAVTTRFDASGNEFNLALHVSDDNDAVVRRRGRLCEALGFRADRLTCCERAHGSRVAIIDEESAGRGAFSRSDALAGYDAMITDVPGALLAMFAADCPLTALADPGRRAIGICHSGWRGLAEGVIGKTIGAMKERFGCAAGTMLAGTAPAIERACYEVGEEVAGRFARHHGECLTQLKNGKYLLDLRGVVRGQLVAAGVKAGNIEQSELCTKCRADMFFSHRRDAGRAGRFALVAGIRA